MDRVTVELEYCYGIRKLRHQFDFSERRVYAVYAPNGSMKSSLAETFKNLADGVKSTDRIFPARASVRKILDENGVELSPESVLVLPPYDEFFHTERTSTLLVNNSLRKDFEQLHEELDRSKDSFLKAMKVQSGSSKKLDTEIALTFAKTGDEESFYVALDRVKNELDEQRDAPFSDVRYDAIFDDKILSALAAKDFKTAIQGYISRYNELLSSSTYFRKGVFEYYNASQIARTLADNGFFDAQHTITLQAKDKLEISTHEQLESIIAKELEEITKDKALKKKFAEIKKSFEKNITLRQFHKYLCDNEQLLPHLANVDLFKEQIWKSYFKANHALYDALVGEYRRVKARRKDIEEQARRERNLWETAIDLFNRRFFVPFTLEAKNKTAVALGHTPMLDLGYTFRDNGDAVPVERDTLMKALSQGEKKALYILNIIFEIEARRQASQETLFVIDDIADSFDYRNKYAIIEYLRDISEGPLFKQIILTHNFDFFRTIFSRFVGYPGCLMVIKDSDGVSLTQAVGIKNVFVNDWKQHFFTDGKKRVASIPFLRNLIEYTRGKDAADYVTLTSLLHWKGGSAAITHRQLDEIYARVFGGNDAYAVPDGSVAELIQSEAVDCLEAPRGINFEHKIVLSVAIRLVAERYMAAKIADDAYVQSIESNQTAALLKRFREMSAGDEETVETLRGVVLMTPENIHLNAFMYEPI